MSSLESIDASAPQELDTSILELFKRESTKRFGDGISFVDGRPLFVVTKRWGPNVYGGMGSERGTRELFVPKTPWLPIVGQDYFICGIREGGMADMTWR